MNGTTAASGGEALGARRRRLLPRRSVRLKLALLYGGLLLVSGAILVGATYALVDHATGNSEFLRSGHREMWFGTRGKTFPGPVVAGQSSIRTGSGPGSGGLSVTEATGGDLPPPPIVKDQGGHLVVSVVVDGRTVQIPIPRGVATGHPLTAGQIQDQFRILRAQAFHQHKEEMHQLLLYSGVALGFLALLSVVLGWLLAGRVLRPVHVITSAARDISATNLHERIALDGPDDELKELGDTFDGLLERLEKSFGAQQAFVSNASHELRTPLARQRALLEVALADPEASVSSLRSMAEQVLAAGEEQERLIEALLTLAVSERGLDRRESIDLGFVTERALDGRREEAGLRSLRLTEYVRSCCIDGRSALVERMVGNLVDNALRYNTEDGWVTVSTGLRAGAAFVCVANAGPKVSEDDLERIFRPFERSGAARVDGTEGHGLGLSIVSAVVEAHRATLTARAREGGGLEIEVVFPPPLLAPTTVTQSAERQHDSAPSPGRA